MFSVFLCRAARDIPDNELSQSEGEELFAHNRDQRICRLDAYGKFRSRFEITHVVLARSERNKRLLVNVGVEFAVNKRD
jgi:hypothetical protein